jgi:cell division protein FtsB
MVFLQAEETVAKWEETKKQQKAMARLKQRMTEKEQENDKLYKQVELTKHALDR